MLKQFTKSQLLNLYELLVREEMLPCDHLKVYLDDGFIKYIERPLWKIKFLKGDKILHVTLATKREIDTDSLSKQLWKYYGGNR